MNLDHVIDKPAVAEAGGHDLLGAAGFEVGSERRVTADEIQQLLERLGHLGVVSSPGGSAHNTVASIAALRADAEVGYVGVAGREPTDDFSFSDWWQDLGIDTRFVARADDLVGMCVSCTVDGRRSMLTTGGANQTIMRHLSANAAELVGYLQHAAVIHVTSFAGLQEVHALVKILRAAKAAAPDLLLTCDPGALWSREPVPAGVDEVVALSDWLLLNGEEYDAHLRRRGGQPPGRSVLRKGADRVDIFTGRGEVAAKRSYPNPIVLGSDEIVDDTGAGDAFAAGFLLSLVTPSISEAEGVELGMRIAREKLRWPGLHGLPEYAALFRRFRSER